MTAVCINGSCHQKDGDLVCIYTLVQQKICFHADVRCGVKMCPGTIREQRQRDLSFLISPSHSTETQFFLLNLTSVDQYCNGSHPFLLFKYMYYAISSQNIVFSSL